MRPLVVLVAVVTTVALGGCGGDDSTSSTTTLGTNASTTSRHTPTSAAPGTSTTSTVRRTTAPSTSGAPDTTRPGGERVVADYTEFSSPTGNIRCAIDPTRARCDIGEHTWSPPPRPADCELDWGFGISLTGGGSATFVCAGDTVGNGGPALAYGDSLVAGDLRCSSAEDAMTCRDVSTGHGFALSRERFRLS